MICTLANQNFPHPRESRSKLAWNVRDYSAATLQFCKQRQAEEQSSEKN